MESSLRNTTLMFFSDISSHFGAINLQVPHLQTRNEEIRHWCERLKRRRTSLASLPSSQSRAERRQRLKRRLKQSREAEAETKTEVEAAALRWDPAARGLAERLG